MSGQGQADGHRGVEPQLPALYHSFDDASATSQERLLGLTRTSLLATVVAAAGGGVSIGDGPDWAAVVALLAFALAAGCRIVLLQNRPERAWYDARAGAESVKTLSWQFAVGGAPFGRNEPSEAAAQRLTERFRSLIRASAALRAGPDAGDRQVTDWMRELRETPLDKRRDAYVTGRILDQIDWYSTAAARHDLHARRWSQLTLLVQALGVVAATLRVSGTLDVDLMGLAAAGAAAGTAWLESRDHSGLAEAYTTTAHELALVRDELPRELDEQTWATFVADAEAAISREHTSWLARRRAPSPRPGIL